jgi:hypothetical protein
MGAVATLRPRECETYRGIVEIAQVRQRAGIPTRDLAAGITAALLAIVCLLAALAVTLTAGLVPGPNEYNMAAWETRNLPNKWLFLAGQALRGGPPSLEAQDATLTRFFELNQQIDALERQVSDAEQRGTPDETKAAELSALLSERDSIENQVEATLEARVTQIAEEQGLDSSLGVFDMAWPPVDAEFTEAPRTLATSRRDRIELLGSSLLREDLTVPQIEGIEEQKEADDDVSALAFPIGGLGAYPTLIEYPEDYERAVEVIAHEWMHNHLFFRPLGFNYYANNDVRTINETVADLVGREIARLVVERWPIEESEPPPETPRQDGVDLREKLRELREEVDTLLAAGKIDEAEALMETRRQELAAQGYYIRKINQAYFAYLNLYAGEAGSPAAVNPIGPKVDELRKRTGSLERFVQVVGNVTSVPELDEALAQYQ